MATLRQRLLVVTGKGGVGKTTLTAALGLALVRTGRRVLLLEVDPRESLYPLFDVEPSGGAILPVLPGLWVQNVRPRDALDRIVREQVGIDFLWRRIAASPVYRHFAEGAPGLEQVVVLEHARRLLDGRLDGAPTLDAIVLDAPATGHGLGLLEAPRLVADVIHDGPVGRAAAELSAFVDDPAACGVVVVTAAEEMPVHEALDLIAALDSRCGRRPEAVLVNGLLPAPAAGGPEPPSEDPVLELWRDRRAINERELARLAAAWDGPRIELPLVPLDRGPGLAAALEERLASWVGGA